MNDITDKKIVGFQGLRGVAILAIIVSHCEWLTDQNGNTVTIWSGALGVQFFIMLSGFLAALRYSDHKCTMREAINLYRHKLQKYYSFHIIMMLVAIPISLSVLHGGSLLGDIVKVISNVFLVQSWIPLQAVYFSMNGVAWYLSLDLAFAFMLPILIKIIQHIEGKMAVVWIIGINVFEFVLALGVQKYIAQTKVVHWIVYVCPVIRSLDFIIGGVMAMMVKRQENTHKKMSIGGILGMYAALVISVCLLFISTGRSNEIFCTAVWTIPCALLLFCIYIEEVRMNLFKNSILVAVGNISLELFLTHQLVFRYMGKIVRKLGLSINIFWNIMMILVALILAVGIHYYKTLSESH